MKDEKFITCECHGEGILISHIDNGTLTTNKKTEWTTSGYDNEFEMAMFRSYNYKYSLKDRIKYAVWHLWTGKKHKDQMCFNYEKANEIIKFLKDSMK